MKGIKNETMGMRIRMRREMLGMTQEELAERMNIKKASLSAYENDRVDCKASTILELARHLDVTPNYLLLGCMPSKDNDGAYAEEIVNMLLEITDLKVREILTIQIKALVP